MRNYRRSKTYRYRSANRFRSEAAVVPRHFSKTLVEEIELLQAEEGDLGAESGKKPNALVEARRGEETTKRISTTKRRSARALVKDAFAPSLGFAWKSLPVLPWSL